MDKNEVCFWILVGVPFTLASTYIAIRILCECLKMIKDTIDYWRN